MMMIVNDDDDDADDHIFYLLFLLFKKIRAETYRNAAKPCEACGISHFEKPPADRPEAFSGICPFLGKRELGRGARLLEIPQCP